MPSDNIFRSVLRFILIDASKEPPNFAGHFRFTFWACSSKCDAGKVIDLTTGSMYSPPQLENEVYPWVISNSFFEGSGVHFRADSRLVIVKTGVNWSYVLKENTQNVCYFTWEGDRFRQLLSISGRQPSNRDGMSPIIILH